METKNSIKTGVVIPKNAVAKSNDAKKCNRTLRQTPIYRDMSNLKYMVVALYNKIPRKFYKYLDSVVTTATEAKKTVVLAVGSCTPQARVEYLTLTIAFVEDIVGDAVIMGQLNLVSTELEKKIKSMAQNVIKQAVALRDYSKKPE